MAARRICHGEARSGGDPAPGKREDKGWFRLRLAMIKRLEFSHVYKQLLEVKVMSKLRVDVLFFL